MSVLELTKENFESTIKDNNIVIIDFWASWCAPCMGFAPVFEEASKKHTDITFGKVDTEVEQELYAAFKIKGIPFIMIFRENILLYAEAGALPAAMLDDLLEQVKNVDMEEIRAKLTE